MFTANLVSFALLPFHKQAEAEEEPLHIAAVHIPSSARQQLCRAWSRVKRSLYSSSDEFLELVEQVCVRFRLDCPLPTLPVFCRESPYAFQFNVSFAHGVFAACS
jgi:hypothetical protein